MILEHLVADHVDRPPSQYAGDPVGFVRRQLHEYMWSKQQEILESVWSHQRTAVPACFGAGKSWIAARAAASWIETHPSEAIVVTTATTFRQVKVVLWREIRRAHLKGGLSGRVNQTEWYVGDGEREEIVAFGSKPQDNDATAFQGLHERYVLVILDEADGVSQELYDAALGLVVNPDSRILAIGNPWNPMGPFAKACAPGSGWNTIRISAFDTPNFTGEDVIEEAAVRLISPQWVEDRKRDWGEEDPRYVSKVLAEFPEDVEGALIPFTDIAAAQQRVLPKTRPHELGVDVAWLGDDSTVIMRRWGGHVRVAKVVRHQDTQAVAGHVWLEFFTDRDTTAIKVDVSPPGVFDALRAADVPVNVIGLNFGWAATDPETFINARAEWYWELRKLFRLGQIDIDPQDDELAAELASLRLLPPDSRGRVRLESKADMRKRGMRSPDRADALVLAFNGGGLGKMYPKLIAATNGHGGPGHDLLDETLTGF